MSEQRLALAGAEIATLDDDLCSRILQWLCGDGPPPASIPEDLRWALVYCDDGVTWGRFDAPPREWRLASYLIPQVSPPVRAQRLQHLRLFGASAELLIWKDGNGLRGRILKDAADPGSLKGPLRPSDEDRILLGDQVLQRLQEGFTHVGDRAGLHQVLPLSVATEDLQGRRARLKVRHYWEQDPDTGTVRIRATRLVDVFIQERS